jgi:BTB/POZ domain-containing protein KCTD9
MADQPRLSYDDTVRRLVELDLLDAGEHPPIPDRLPQPDDEVAGISFFRTFVGDGADLSGLTMPRTFFGRSEIRGVSFRNSDLAESNLCWNDFADVDFSDAVLAGADLRAARYTRVTFARTDLRAADLRRAEFEACSFDGALMDGARLTRAQGQRLPLSHAQRAAVDWQEEEGEEPGGG